MASNTEAASEAASASDGLARSRRRSSGRRARSVSGSGPSRLSASGRTSIPDKSAISGNTSSVQSVPNGATAAGLLYTAPTLGSTAAERFFALSIAGARKTLYITNSYFAPDRNFIDLLSATARRGVDVRILTAGPGTDLEDGQSQANDLLVKFGDVDFI